MSRRIVWSKRAAQDLDAITDYIGADSPAYAGIVLKSMVNQTRILERSTSKAAKHPNLTIRTYANL
jgi:toxin ParE1/3/4